MVTIQTLDMLLSIINSYKSDNITYQIIGSVTEGFSGMYSGTKPKDNVLEVRLIVFSSISTLYFTHNFKLTDSENILEVKFKLGSLSIIPGDVSIRNGMPTIH